MSDYTPGLKDAQSYYVAGRVAVRRQATREQAVDITPYSHEFDRFIAKVKAEAWDEGASDGQWNFEHEGQIERGTRQPITNPYRENGDNNE